MHNIDSPLLIPLASGPVNGSVSLPGSKSYTNRAFPIAALAQGTSTITGVLDSDDTRYMAAALEVLGIDLDVNWADAVATVTGCDGSLPATSGRLFLGNSGTSMRFLTAFCALGTGKYILDGTDAMRLRPLGPLIDGLRSLGASIRCLERDDCPPLEIQASSIDGSTVSMNGELSSQYFTALAMTMPYSRSNLTVEVLGELVSKPYLDITADVMEAFGVELTIEDYRRFSVPDGSRYRATYFEVEPDASAASYFFALAAVTGGTITVERLPWSSKQGDLKFVNVLEQMGCTVDRPGSAVTVQGPAQLSGVDVDMSDISDTVMSVAAIAPFATSPVAIRNIGHIRVKETDRIHAIVTELRKLGISVDETQDSISIQPGKPEPGIVDTYDDHRMAMAFAILGTQTSGIQIADPGCVAKTVPGYWELLLPLLGRDTPAVV